MILCELFDSWEPITYAVNSDRRVLAKFKVDDKNFEFEAEESSVSPSHKNYKMWWCSFYLTTPTGAVSYHLMPGSNERTGIKVMSTVTKVLQRMIQEKEPLGLKFSASLREPSRVKLYQRMVDKFASQGWDAEKKTDSTDMVFTLRRKNDPTRTI